MRQFALVLALCAAAPAAAQLPTDPPMMPSVSAPPQIVAPGHGEVRVAPDRATINIAVQTRGSTAAAAGAENARKQRAVLDTLRALGIAADQISTRDYNVYPEQQFDERAKVARVVGYNVTNTVQVEVRKIEQIGTLIDAVLGKGANMITSLDFYSSNTDQARRTAMTRAIERARADADAAARAAGGTLGPLLEINVNSLPQPPIILNKAMAMREQAASAETPVSSGTLAVAVDVYTRWRFQPGAR